MPRHRKFLMVSPEKLNIIIRSVFDFAQTDIGCYTIRRGRQDDDRLIFQNSLITNPGLIFMSDSPAKNAAQLIDSYCITSPDKLDIEEIAWAEKLAIKEMPLKNYMGLINFKKNFGIISINSDIVEPGQRKFTIAHEMGHFFNEKDRLTHLR